MEKYCNIIDVKNKLINDLDKSFTEVKIKRAIQSATRQISGLCGNLWKKDYFIQEEIALEQTPTATVTIAKQPSYPSRLNIVINSKFGLTSGTVVITGTINNVLAQSETITISLNDGESFVYTTTGIFSSITTIDATSIADNSSTIAVDTEGDPFISELTSDKAIFLLLDWNIGNSYEADKSDTTVQNMLTNFMYNMNLLLKKNSDRYIKLHLDPVQIYDKEINFNNAQYYEDEYMLLDHNKLIPNTVKVYSLANYGGTEYIRDYDYAVDTAKGRIKIKGGNLVSTQTVYVSYKFYKMYNRIGY